MRAVLYLRSRGLLTEQQVVTAMRFKKDPSAFRLAPTLTRFLHDVIVKDRGLEEIERTRGWSVRSAKVLLSQLLFALEECDGMFWDDGETERETVEDLRDTIDFLTATDVTEISKLMVEHGLSRRLARLLMILRRAGGPVDAETLYRRLYADLNEADWPSGGTLSVHIHDLRKRLPSGMSIVNIRGVGYYLAAGQQ